MTFYYVGNIVTWRFDSRQIKEYFSSTSPVAKRPGHEADHSPPSSVGVKYVYIYTYRFPYTVMVYTGTVVLLHYIDVHFLSHRKHYVSIT
jgi:hypothetical protein